MDEEVTTTQDEFMELAYDANKPLYPGCDRHTKLNIVLIRLYNMKAKHSMSDVAFSELLVTFSELLSEGNVMPSTAYKAKKTLTALKLDYTKIDACPNDKIWQCVQGAFVIGSESKKVVLELAAARWREFKNRLTTKYIIPYLNEPEMFKFHPDDYRFINVDHWSTFVVERSCPKFLAKRAVQQEKRKKNKYPHRMSRKGYANLEEELSATLGLDDEEVSREDLWIEAQKGPDGEFKDEDTKSIAEEISELKEKVKSGECIIDGADDVLSKALGPEHGGRVRGVGGFVTPSTYFHLPRRKRTSMQETIQKMLKEAVENERAFWVQKLAAIEARLPPGAGDGDGCNTPDLN